MADRGKHSRLAALVAAVALGTGASVAVSACGEDERGDVQVETGGTGTGGTGTAGTGTTTAPTTETTGTGTTETQGTGTSP